MSQVTQEVDIRTQEKEEEFDHVRKYYQITMESIQASDLLSPRPDPRSRL